MLLLQWGRGIHGHHMPPVSHIHVHMNASYGCHKLYTFQYDVRKNETVQTHPGGGREPDVVWWCIVGQFKQTTTVLFAFTSRPIETVKAITWCYSQWMIINNSAITRISVVCFPWVAITRTGRYWWRHRRSCMKRYLIKLLMVTYTWVRCFGHMLKHTSRLF